jgi:hypothetical protein
MDYIRASIMDSESGRYMTIVYSPEDRSAVDQYWEDTDNILLNIQSLAPFKGRTRWCDLSPIHYKFLMTRAIEQTFDLLADAPEDEVQSDDLNERPTIASMNFIIMAYAKAYELASGSQIENLRISRHDVNEITMNILTYVSTNFEGLKAFVDEPAAKPPSLKLITRDDE